MEVASHFTDSDGDTLRFRAASSNPAVAAADADGSVVTARALSRGSATVTVAAADPDGLETTLGFDVTVPSSAPWIIAPLPDLDLDVGAERVLHASDYFSDPDGDALRLEAASSNQAAVEVAPSRDSIVVKGVSMGSATVAVSAVDPEGLAAQQSFDVGVSRMPTSGCDIDLGFTSNITAAQRAAITAARWPSRALRDPG